MAAIAKPNLRCILAPPPNWDAPSIIAAGPGSRRDQIGKFRYVTAMTAPTISVSPAELLAEKEVLALAALAWPEAERADLWRDIRQAATYDARAVVLLAARTTDRLVGAALAHILPGRAAVVWPPQIAADVVD